VISTALKQNRAEEAWVRASIASMTQLNREPADALHEIYDSAPADKPVHAVTDVTGFGLLGHAREVAVGSGVSMRIDHNRLAYLPGAVDAARNRFFSGGLANNREFLDGCVGFLETVPEEFRALLFDPQTSGGLLVAVAPQAAGRAMAAFERRNIPARIIGEIIAKRSPLIEVS
jgi:selenide,water dikinase